MADAVNPYAPPGESLAPLPPGPLTEAEITAARRALAEHLADPGLAEAELRMARRLPFLVGMMPILFGVVVAVIGGVFNNHILLVVGPTGLVAALIWLWWGSSAIGPKHPRREPGRTLRQFLTTLAEGRHTTTVGCLAPPARMVDLGRGPGLFRHGLGHHGRQIGRCVSPGIWSLARSHFRRIASVSTSGDIARVEIDTVSEHPHRVLQLVPAICWVVLVVIVWEQFHITWMIALPLLFGVPLLLARIFVRRERRPAITKVLIRGSNGLWYLVDGVRTDDGAPTDHVPVQPAA